MWRWNPGRQESGYDKFPIMVMSWPFKWDLYLLRFPTGSEIEPHVDPVSSGKHYRMNIVVKPALSGGDFHCDITIINTPRIKLFRPDECVHSVSKVTKGTRYVISTGWVTR